MMVVEGLFDVRWIDETVWYRKK